MQFCNFVLHSRHKYDNVGLHVCHLPKGHKGAHSEFPYLAQLASAAKSVRAKIIRDSTMTTGAAWKSEGAGPNRCPRWLMLETDEELEARGIKITGWRPEIVSKLRDKAATYEQCMQVAPRLTWLAYGMANAPVPTTAVSEYLEAMVGPLRTGDTRCLVCKDVLDFSLFKQAKRGRAEIETAHANPRVHTAENVGFAHRACNIAQGNKTLDEFYTWIGQILARVGGDVDGRR